MVELRPKGSPVAQVPVPTERPADMPSVLDETRKELEKADRLHTPGGARAMALALRIDSCELDSALAGLVKQHESTLAAAVHGAVVDPDELDDLQAKRAERERLALGG